MIAEKIFRLRADVRFEDKLEHSASQRVESYVCPVDAGSKSEHARHQRWVRPLRVIGPVRAFTDLEWTVYGDILVPMETVSAFQSAGFSGFKYHRAELFSTTETPIGREVFELRVTGWGGRASPESGISVLTECPVCGRRVYSGFTDPSKLFDLDSWDGSDFFIIWPMPRYIFVTGRVRDYILRRGYTGVRFEPVGKLAPPPMSKLVPSAYGFSPGHLRDWFDDDRIEEIRKTQKGIQPIA